MEDRYSEVDQIHVHHTLLVRYSAQLTRRLRRGSGLSLLERDRVELVGQDAKHPVPATKEAVRRIGRVGQRDAVAFAHALDLQLSTDHTHPALAPGSIPT